MKTYISRSHNEARSAGNIVPLSSLTTALDILWTSKPCSLLPSCTSHPSPLSFSTQHSEDIYVGRSLNEARSAGNTIHLCSLTIGWTFYILWTSQPCSALPPVHLIRLLCIQIQPSVPNLITSPLNLPTLLLPLHPASRKFADIFPPGLGS